SDGGSRRQEPSWALAVAWGAAPARHALAGTAEVELGRGKSTSPTRHGVSLRLELDDAGGSQPHARLSLVGDSWMVDDAGSKNGTFVDGQRVERAVLTDGSVIECGGIFLVLRRSARRVADLMTPAGTLSPLLERELAALARIAPSRVSVLI